MPLRDLLKKKDTGAAEEVPMPSVSLPQATEFMFVRTDTHTQEVINPPVFEGESEPGVWATAANASTPPKRAFSRFRKSSSTPFPDWTSPQKEQKEHKRLSERFHLTKSRSASTSSVNLPADLPDIDDAYSDQGDRQEKEAKWEERATILASKSPNLAGKSPTAASRPPTADISCLNLNGPERSDAGPSNRPRSISDEKSDANIQEAIRLHEAGELEAATHMFQQLAESGNVLSQVLYGLSLRHGWGCEPDQERAVSYLSAAASNSATIEAEALKAGVKKGGAAKGELVLAIFELANCFRNGWGVPVDKVAARQYYETAANLGDTDAMNEAAWCYLEGFGGKKDKVSGPVLLVLRASAWPMAAAAPVSLSLPPSDRPIARRRTRAC